MTENQHFISAAGLVKIFQVAGLEVVALQGLDPGSTVLFKNLQIKALP